MEAQSFDKRELRHISTLLNELQYKRIALDNVKQETYYYKSSISNLEKQIAKMQTIKDLQDRKIEIVKPKWWDKFWIGAVITTVSFLLIQAGLK